MKKVLSLALVSLMILSLLLTGCSQKPAENTNTPSDSSTSTDAPADSSTSTLSAPGELPLTSEPAELSVLTFDNWYAPTNYDQNLPVWQEIEKNTNVKINWELTSNSQLRDVINTRFASGENLPDIVFGWFDYQKFAKNGSIIDLTQLLADNAPNIMKLFEETPSLKGLLTESDGKILSLTQSVMTDDQQPAYLIRKDWLDKLGKEVPTTTDEFVDVLRAIRDGDPNGNGQKDEIPLIFKGLDWLWFSAASFQCHPDFSDCEFYPNENGEVEFVSTQESFKEYLKWLNMLYEEGLLSQEFATIPYEKIDSLRNNNQLGVQPNFINNLDTYNGQMPDAEWIGFVPPAGPYGEAQLQRRVPISGNCVVTKDCENPALAVKWLDYIMASEDGQILNSYGVEGLSYEMVDGKPALGEFLTNNPDGLSYSDAIRSIGGQWNLPQVQSVELFEATSSDLTLEVNEEIKKILVDCYPGMLIPKTEEEQAAITQYYPDLKTYRDEMVLKFIMGKADIDAEWNTYVATLNELGAEKLTADQQNIYARYVEATK